MNCYPMPNNYRQWRDTGPAIEQQRGQMQAMSGLSS
jgi:hypothetical protein